MNLREHVILGGAAAAALSPVLGGPESLVFFASSVLIDVDHYWDYLQRNEFRNWSFGKTFEFHRVLFRNIHAPDFLAMNLFHTIEWFLLVYLWGTWLGSSAVFAALAGMVYHLFLDVVRLAWHRATFKRALSLIEYWFRRRALIRQGLDPDRPYQDALVEIGVVTTTGREPEPAAGRTT